MHCVSPAPSSPIAPKSSGHTTPKYSSRRLRRRFIKSGPVWVIRYRLGARRKTLYVRNPLKADAKTSVEDIHLSAYRRALGYSGEDNDSLPLAVPGDD